MIVPVAPDAYGGDLPVADLPEALADLSLAIEDPFCLPLKGLGHVLHALPEELEDAVGQGQHRVIEGLAVKFGKRLRGKIRILRVLAQREMKLRGPPTQEPGRREIRTRGLENARGWLVLAEGGGRRLGQRGHRPRRR